MSLCAGRRDHTYHYVPGEYHNVPGEYHTYHYVPGEYHNVPGEPLRSGRGFLVRRWEAPTKGYSVPTHDLQHAFPSEVVPGVIHMKYDRHEVRLAEMCMHEVQDPRKVCFFSHGVGSTHSRVFIFQPRSACWEFRHGFVPGAGSLGVGSYQALGV